MKSHPTARASSIRSIRVTGWWGGQSASSECARSARVLGFVIYLHISEANFGSCRDRRPVICGYCFLVAVPPVSDLLLRAKHLFVAAIADGDAARRAAVRSAAQVRQQEADGGGHVTHRRKAPAVGPGGEPERGLS